MTDVNDMTAGDPFADAQPTEAPNCTTCCDSGFLLDLAAEGHVGSGQNCPDCNPTTEQSAATTAEFQRRVDADETDPTADPF